MNIILNFKEIVRQYVAPHRRQPNRLAWLWGLIDLDSVWATFAAWRAYYRYKVHVTSQQGSLLGHLRNLFGRGIVLKSYSGMYLEVGLNSEPAHMVILNPYREVALEGESQSAFDGADFVIYVPSGVDISNMGEEIERYKLADKTFKIIQR